ncbi:MAG: PH domain-containing protein [Bdellovibrionota bacterium]|nr:PH domain-containing protein [Pseudomonadota bacterium]MDY6090271.1 PH domain-containing protein [Bdellovibrionota bacterium]
MKIKTVRPSLKALLLFFIFSSCPLTIFYIILNLLGSLSNPKIGSLVNSLYYLLIIICFLEVIRRYFNDRYVIYSDKIISIQGLISFHLTRNTIDYLDIREIKTNQTILGRMVGYGDLLISTASTSGIEITLRYIDNVNDLNQEIIKYKNKLQVSMPNTSNM